MVKIRNIELGNFPILLAPMEDVSDPPFRFVCKQNGADLMYTEFISSEGLIRHAAKSTQKLDIFEYERPIGIQLFGSEIESMREAAEIATATPVSSSAINPPIRLNTMPKMKYSPKTIIRCERALRTGLIAGSGVGVFSSIKKAVPLQINAF